MKHKISSKLGLALLGLSSLHFQMFGAAPVTDSNTAESSLKALCLSLSEGQYSEIWKALPATYQSDIESLVKSYAQVQDPEIYEKSQQLFGKLVQIFKSKKQLILDNAQLQMMLKSSKDKMTLEQLSQSWDPVIVFIDSFLTDDFPSLEQLKNFNGQKFSSNTMQKFDQCFNAVAKVFESPSASEQLKSVVIKSLSSSENESELEVTFDQKTEKVKLSKVENRWVPTEMASTWTAKLNEAKANIAANKMTPEIKAQTLMMMGLSEGVLDQFLAVSTQAELNQVVQTTMGMVMGMMMQKGGPGMPSGGPGMPSGGPGLPQ
jgi:hypothetical protein